MGKGNTSNLKYPRNTEEAREWGRRGGINSGISRRRKKSIAESMDIFLNKKITDKSHLAAIESSGLAIDDDPTYKDFLVVSVITNSIKRGNIDDLSKIMSLLGEMPMTANVGEDGESNE